MIDENKIKREAEFHDKWANTQQKEDIDVSLTNEACTSPELRYIHDKLGDVRGAEILDVGCGLGEVSVYFALKGARVTSTDLSQGMLDFASQLAQKHGVAIRTHLANAEDFRLPANSFDIIYVGNLFHHVDIEATVVRLKALLRPGGVMVSWDPLAYNPLINIYRAIATEVRTPDEHPLKISDLKTFRKHFAETEYKFFWLSTLIIFIIMVLERRSPNKERYWKKVVEQADRWRPIYEPLEKLDTILFRWIPPLRYLAWNVVVYAKKAGG